MAILGLALVSLAVDRLFLGGGYTGPDPVGAAELDDPAEEREAPAADPETKTLVDASVGRRLEKLRDRNALDPEASRDAFQASPQWAQARHTEGRADSRDNAGPDGHVLTAVMLLENGNAAIINDRHVRVGQEIDGWRLTGVDQRSATLEGSGMTITLRLQSDRGVSAE